MKREAEEIHVLIRINSGQIEEGSLKYQNTGPELFLSSGDSISDNDAVFFSKLESAKDERLPILNNEWIRLKPIHKSVESFSEHLQKTDLMYPRSSENWKAHIVPDGRKVTLIVQEVENKKKVLIVVVDYDSGVLKKIIRANHYEVNALRFKEDFELHNIISEHDHEGDREYIESLLDGDVPKWPQIRRLVRNVDVPNLEIKSTLRETISQLVPDSFPNEIKEEIMAFLVWSMTATIPEFDPLYLSDRYLSIRIFRLLLSGHLLCLLEDIDPPQYIRNMFLADRGMLEASKSPISASGEYSPWIVAWYRFGEEFPDLSGRVIDYAQELTERRAIVSELPVSKSDAAKSKRSWSDRYAMYFNGLSLRADVNNEALGLREVIYFGAAHKWPHKHLSWSARLGGLDAKSKEFQVMLMPPDASAIVVGNKSNFEEIKWSIRKANLSNFDIKKRKWTMPEARLYRTMTSKRTYSQLLREFGSFKFVTEKLSLEECKVLDLLYYEMHLHHLELGRYAEYLGIKKKKMDGIMQSLLERNLILPHYIPSMQGLTSIFLAGKGQPEDVCALARAFLKYSPSTNAFITNEMTSCYLISRLPEESAYEIITKIPDIAEQEGLNLSCLPIRAYSGYRNNLYSRLWMSEGNWDSDLTDLIDQMS